MTSTYHHLAQARVAVLTLTDAPHADLLGAHAGALDELRAAAQETEKLARVHPVTMLKESAVWGFSALSLFSVFVFGKAMASSYLRLQQQISNIEVPFFDVRGEMAKFLPPVPMLEQLSRLPEITWQQAIGASLIVAALVLLIHIVRTFLLLRRERVLAHSAAHLEAAAHVLREAAATPAREKALALLAQGMTDHRK